MSNVSLYEKTPANAKEAVSTLRDLLERNKSKLELAAPKHLSVDRLMRIAISATSHNETLLQCTPASILGAVMQGALLGLEAGGPLSDGFIVPYRNGKQGGRFEAQFIIGYRGLITLARRSGQILSIEADVVYEKDEWTYGKTELGTTFRHVPSEEADPGIVLRAYAVARLKDSPTPVVIVMPRREIEVIRLRARKGDRKTPWDTDYAQMACKTAIRRIAKYLPMSVEVAETFDKEDHVETNDVIDVAPAQKRLRAVAPSEGESKSEDTISGPSEPEIDRSESQEEPAAEILADVLREIEVLRSGHECQQLSDRLKLARWEHEEERKTAASALKSRWRIVLAEEKAAMKAATTTTASSPPMRELGPDDALPGQAPLPIVGAPAALTRCSECGLLKGHSTGCPNSDPTMPGWATQDEKKTAASVASGLDRKPPAGEGVKVKLSDGTYADVGGDEIQGRERDPGEEG